jgi:hypothetical protein
VLAWVLTWAANACWSKIAATREVHLNATEQPTGFKRPPSSSYKKDLCSHGTVPWYNSELNPNSTPLNTKTPCAHLLFHIHDAAKRIIAHNEQYAVSSYRKKPKQPMPGATTQRRAASGGCRKMQFQSQKPTPSFPLQTVETPQG